MSDKHWRRRVYAKKLPLGAVYAFEDNDTHMCLQILHDASNHRFAAEVEVRLPLVGNLGECDVCVAACCAPLGVVRGLNMGYQRLYVLDACITPNVAKRTQSEEL